MSVVVIEFPVSFAFSDVDSTNVSDDEYCGVLNFVVYSIPIVTNTAIISII